MTETNAAKPAARDLIRAYLRGTLRAPTHSELVTALDGTVKRNTIDNFIHDGRKTGEVQVVLAEDGHRRIVLACGDFVPPKKRMCDPATVRIVQDALLDFMRRDCRPVSIDVLIAAMPEGTEPLVVRALVRSMAKAKMVLLSLADGSPCYQLSPALRSAGNPNPYHPPRPAQRIESVLPPAPKERVASQAPTGPAPVATESPASSPSPGADVPSAIAAAPETTLEDVAVMDDGQRLSSVVPSIAEQVRWLADDITTAAKEATAESTDSNTLRLMIDCVANANRLAGLTARGDA